MRPVRLLHLLRHTKSDWAEPGRPDWDRPLAPRGKRAASSIADRLRDRGVAPQLVVCSPARRCRETLERLAPGLPADVAVVFDDRLYHGDVEELVELVHEIPDAVGTVLVVGHNPALQRATLRLAGEGDPATLAGIRKKLPTGALVTLELADDNWATLGPGTARLVRLMTPRDPDS